MFVTLNCSGKFPFRDAFRRSWSATWPSSALMPFSTRPNFVSYDTPGSVTWVHRLDNCSGLGRGGAPGGAWRRWRPAQTARRARRAAPRRRTRRRTQPTSHRPPQLQLRRRLPPRWRAFSRSLLSLRFGLNIRCHSAGHRVVCGEPVTGVSYHWLSYSKHSHARWVRDRSVNRRASRHGFATRRHPAAVARIRRNVLPR